MLAPCRLSLRWHQSFCRSPSFPGHQRCVEVLTSIRGYRQSRSLKPLRQPPREIDCNTIDAIRDQRNTASSNITVREYEQHGKDVNTLRRVEPNPEINHELAAVRAQMEKLEQELALMKQGPFGPQSELMQSLPRDEREELLKALADEGILQDDDDNSITLEEIQRMAEEEEAGEKAMKPNRLGVTLRIPRKDQAYIRGFNNALRIADEAEGNVRKGLMLWTWYLRCQQHVRNFSTIISNDVWLVLWRTQAALELRPRHIVMLARDMQEAGETLDHSKWIEYIEALHASGDNATAIEVWQTQKSAIESTPDARHTYQALGVKLYAALGRPLKAQELALNAIHHHQAPPHILIPVIIAWANSQGSEALVKAWANYLRLRELLGSSIEPEVLEEISNAFLRAESADMAVSVFKDMLLSKEQSAFDSRSVYRQAVRHLGEAMQKASTEEQINRIGLSTMLLLPNKFQNRFFFTSWIKKLIGEGRVDAATMVVELMYERGITPDARPLNGILGAWFREGSVKSQQKAVKMAWAMIDAKIELVKNQAARKSGNLLREILPPGDLGYARRAVFLRNRLPAASIETFSILLLHYTRGSDFAEAERLTQVMTGPCQIKPNSFIMNHWLHADLRSSKLDQVWVKFQDLSAEIAPDLETFAILWDTGKARYSRSASGNVKGFPSARQLFAQMLSWAESLEARKLSKATDEFSPELYEQVVRCFCLSQDLAGVLTAVHGLRRRFGAYPDDNSLRLICASAARLLPGEEPRRNRRNKPRHRNILARVADIIENIAAQRKSELIEQGAEIEVLNDDETEAAQNLKLSVVTEFICMFLHQTQSSTGSYLNDIKIAAETMGVDLNEVDLSVATATT